jgi:malonyl-CoA/methylmalonyl-CoA synthetase
MSAPADQSPRGTGGHFLDEIRTTFARRSGEEAIRHRTGSLTYEALDRLARRWACALRDLGLTEGDRVAIITPEKLRFLGAHLGVLYAGGVSLPLNPRFTRDELRYFLEDSGARAVVAGDVERPVVESLLAELPQLGAVVADVDPTHASERPYAETSIARDVPCLLLYSSGTTGRPKGVVHTHANLAASVRALGECWQFTPEDVLANVLPLFHIHGLSFATHLSLLVGARMIIDQSFHPRKTLDLLGQATVFMAIPTFYYSLLERPEFRVDARQWRNLRLVTCGSAPIRAELLPELEEVLGRPVINRYGMTEAHVITSLPLSGPWPYGSVGLPLAGVEVQLVREDGSPAPPGDVGSVRIRGPNLFREYWQKPDATRTAFASGWFDTGDLGTRDNADFLTLVGRKNDLIITSGFNVYPQVVERVINECPGVRESAVVGAPDRKRGERVVAAVVRSDQALSERTLRAHLNERLVDYQRPSEILFVEALPRNAMGKVLRGELLKTRISG